MNFSIAYFLAWRYTQGTKNQTTINTMVWVCSISIFISTCSLALILAIMRGFEVETRKKLQGIHPDIFIEAYHGKYIDGPALSSFLNKQYPDQIQATTTYSNQHVLLHPTTQEETTILGMLKGIDPKQEPSVTALDKTIINSTPSTSLNILQNHHPEPIVIIGKGVADTLHVQKDDLFSMLYNQNNDTQLSQATFCSMQVKVGGIITTGISEYDDGLILCDHQTIKTLFQDENITSVGIKIKQKCNEFELIKTLRTQMPDLHIYSWKDLYPSLLSALTVEKYAMFFIFGLICLIASMNMISLLYMYITYKRTDIALLQLLGVSKKTISIIFLLFSLCISTCASLAGLITAYFLGLFLKTYPFITLPDVYYVSHLPIELDPLLFVYVFAVTMLLSCCCAYLPLRSLNSISITKILRFE